MMGIGLALAGVIGLSLGLLGGGGSILTVPIFVYVLGFGAKEAIAASLAVVGATSVLGALGHWRAGNVNVRVALVFGAVAMVGAYAGARLSAYVSGPVQLTVFAGVMLAAAVFMFRGRRGEAGGSRAEAGAGGGGDLRFPLIAAEGIAVGLLSGLVGVGGGFLIVPALVLLGGLPMKEAVGTSLLVIALNSGAGFYGYLGQVQVPWGLLAEFTALAAVGIAAGTVLVRYVSQGALRRGFAAFLVVMGVFILYRNRSVFLPTASPGAVPTVQTTRPEPGATAVETTGPEPAVGASAGATHALGD